MVIRQFFLFSGLTNQTSKTGDEQKTGDKEWSPSFQYTKPAGKEGCRLAPSILCEQK